ncbi:MAG: hypothetical protein QOI81_1618 [Actinomycetota bacterium]|nr:hypothetical protein [Actinomycetota bacterium]
MQDDVGRIGVQGGPPRGHDADERDHDEDRKEHVSSLAPPVPLPSIYGCHFPRWSCREKCVRDGTSPATEREWARQVLNLRPLACEASALPLSYAPGSRLHDTKRAAADPGQGDGGTCPRRAAVGPSHWDSDV